MIITGALIPFALLDYAVPASAAPVPVSDNSGFSEFPEIAIDSNDIYVVWRDDEFGDWETFFAKSTDGGETFSEVNVSNNDGELDDIAESEGQAQMGITNDAIYIVWEDDDSGNSEILVANSTNGGDSFGSAINLSQNNGASVDPQIATLGSNVYVVWRDFISGNNEIRFSNNTGDSFGSPINVSNTPTHHSFNPKVAVSDSGDIYVVWQDTISGNDEVMFAQSINNGVSFSSAKNLSNNNGDSGNIDLGVPQIATLGSNVYVVWADDSSGNPEILLSISEDNGLNFGSPIHVSGGTKSSFAPQIAVSDDANIYVIWSQEVTPADTDNPATSDIQLAVSTDNGETFSEVNVSNNAAGSSTNPQLAISDSGDLYAVWEDTYLGSSEILAGESIDGGSTFSSPVNVSDSPDDNSVDPHLTVSGSDVYIVWYDDIPDGNVFFSSGIDFTFPSITIDSVDSDEPMWGDEVSVSGSTTGSIDGDSVTVDWGDGSMNQTIAIAVGGSWGPVEHSYSSDSIGAIEITAMLEGDSGLRATSDPSPIDVQKRATGLTLNDIASVVQGSDVSVSGTITDAGTEEGIEGLTITFNGTGAEGILPDAVSDPDGLFSSTGTSEDTPATGWLVQAHFAGDDAYEASDSTVKAYDTASSSATAFAVGEGTDVHVDLEGFGASIDFEDVTGGGQVFVSECSDSANSRYIPVDGMCLIISSSAEMAGNSYARVQMSFAGRELPDGYAADSLDVFHEDSLEGIVDITESRDDGTVMGKTSSFSKFAGGIALHDEAPDSVTKQIFVGSGSEISLRDIGNNDASSATLSLDKTVFKKGQDVAVTLEYPDENRDLDNVDTVAVTATSDSDSAGINIALTETGTNTGSFHGNFELTSSSSADGLLHVESGDNFKVSYDPSVGSRFRATFGDVIESGVAHATEFEIDETNACFTWLGHAVDLDLSYVRVNTTNDELIYSGDPANRPAVVPGGDIMATMSYANVVVDPNPVGALKLYHKVNETWYDITIPGGVDVSAKTVTGKTQVDGPFSLGVDTGCPGGAGGGLARPGTGIVLDFVASIAKSGSGGRGAPSIVKLDNSAPDNPRTFSFGEVKVTFEDASQGDVHVNTLGLDKLPDAFEEINSDHGKMSFDGSSYSTVGTLFDIDASDVSFDGAIDVTIPYDETMIGAGMSESDARFMHYNTETGKWEDVTVGIDTDANTVSGRLSSLSPVVAAVVEDGTFAKLYFEQNPLKEIRILAINVTKNATTSGTDITGSYAAGQTITIYSTLKNVQREDQQYTLLMQVSDKDGIVSSINWQMGSLTRGQSIHVASSWMPDQVGTYSIQIFVWDHIDDPSALSDVIIRTVVIQD